MRADDFSPPESSRTLVKNLAREVSHGCRENRELSRSRCVGISNRSTLPASIADRAGPGAPKRWTVVEVDRNLNEPGKTAGVMVVTDSNRTDVTTPKEMVTRSKRRFGKARRIWVMDRAEDPHG
jgi:hypothetical protein